MAKSSIKMPSKTAMAKEDRQYKARSMVRDMMENSPEFKKMCAAAEKELMQAEKNVQQHMKGKK